jgi:hypothetical protein
VERCEGCATAVTGSPRPPTATIISLSPTRVTRPVPPSTFSMAVAEPLAYWKSTRSPSRSKSPVTSAIISGV